MNKKEKISDSLEKEQKFEKDFDENMEGPLKSIKCDSCDNIFCKKIYFNGEEGVYTKWMCKNCFVKLKKSYYSLGIALKEIIDGLKVELPWWKKLFTKRSKK